MTLFQLFYYKCTHMNGKYKEFHNNNLFDKAYDYHIVKIESFIKYFLKASFFEFNFNLSNL